jgi:hypothetical protein
MLLDRGHDQQGMQQWYDNHGKEGLEAYRLLLEKTSSNECVFDLELFPWYARAGRDGLRVAKMVLDRGPELRGLQQWYDNHGIEGLEIYEALLISNPGECVFGLELFAWYRADGYDGIVLAKMVLDGGHELHGMQQWYDNHGIEGLRAYGELFENFPTQCDFGLELFPWYANAGKDGIKFAKMTVDYGHALHGLQQWYDAHDIRGAGAYVHLLTQFPQECTFDLWLFEWMMVSMPAGVLAKRVADLGHPVSCLQDWWNMYEAKGVEMYQLLIDEFPAEYLFDTSLGSFYERAGAAGMFEAKRLIDAGSFQRRD